MKQIQQTKVPAPFFYTANKRVGSALLTTSVAEVARLWTIATIVVAFSLATTTTQAQETGLTAALALEKSLIGSIEKAGPSVVAIARAAKGDAESKLLSPDYVPAEYATGVVVDAKGLILTNYHVLGQPDRNEYAVWINKRPFQAKLKAADPWIDLAILEVASKDLVPIKFGDASKLKKGQIVVSLGNPHAIARDGSPSATWGIVSNIGRGPVGRRIPNSSQRDKSTVHHFGTLIQTDARLNKGTSGGALLNLQGEMIGLTTAIGALPGFEEAAGFAIPIDEKFKRAIDELKKGRAPEHGFLGVATEPVMVADRQAGRHGVELRAVVPGTPAARGGLMRADIITHVGKDKVHGTDDLIRLVSLRTPGTKTRLAVRRYDFRAQRITALVRHITLAKKPVENAQPVYETNARPPWRGVLVDYTTVLPEFADRAPELNGISQIAVVYVEEDSPAWKAGIRKGQVVTHIDKQKVELPAEFYDAVDPKSVEVSVRLAAEPDGVAQTVVVPGSEDSFNGKP